MNIQEGEHADVQLSTQKSGVNGRDLGVRLTMRMESFLRSRST